MENEDKKCRWKAIAEAENAKGEVGSLEKCLSCSGFDTSCMDYMPRVYARNKYGYPEVEKR